MDQEELGRLRRDLCILAGSMTNFPQPTIPTLGNTSSHHVPDQYNNALFYGMMPYNCVEHHPPGANFYDPYMNPASSTQLLPASFFGSSEPLSSYANHGAVNIPTNEYGRQNFVMDANRACKRKDADGIPRNYQHFDASAGSSSSTLNARHFESGDALMDAESFVPAQYRMNDPPSVMEAGARRTVRNRVGASVQDSAVPHGQNYMLPGSYIGQPFHPTGSPWLDQLIINSRGDGSTMSWIQAPAAPYLHGSNVNGSSGETGFVGLQGYNESPSVQHGHHLRHPPLPPLLPGPSFYQHIAPPSFPANNMRLRHPVPPTGFRIYRSPHNMQAVPEATPRPHSLPYLRVLPADEVAILELPGYSEAVNSVDRHRDMRLDIEDMSYEELLALGERIGTVKTGLSEETIRKHLKTRIHVSSNTFPKLEEPARGNKEAESCIICQSEFENQNWIGILRCGHDYHADCLEKWLLVKNVCPICKSPALTTTEKKDS